MQLTSPAFEDNQPIPEDFAFCVPDAKQHARLGANKNPPLRWSGLPEGTKSLALICHDPDVPSKPDDVNQEGSVVPADLPRVDFYHWVLVDLAPEPAEIKVGEFSEGVTSGGKSGPEGPRGTRQGTNNYLDWFSNDPEMSGDYYGYDGPCPPWNDSIMHHYVFTLYALDCERCPLEGRFTGAQVLDAIESHVLAKASLTGTYTLNPEI